MEPDQKDDEDTSTKQILDYYRKYSQNRDLPKYFSGTSVAYLPKIVEDKKENTTTNVQINVELAIEGKPKDEDELSPGSLASNRKLEWDNLGDIGYDNVKTIVRSSSLPVLPTKVDFLSSDPSKSTSSDSNVKVIVNPYTSTSSSEENSAHVKSDSSSSSVEKKLPTTLSTITNSGSKDIESSESSNDNKLIDFKKTLQFLKSKIGLPDAQSTPCETSAKSEQFETLSNTPIIKRSENIKMKSKKSKSKNIPFLKVDSETINTNFVDMRSQTDDVCPETKDVQSSNSKKRIINLCLTKPLLLDCVANSLDKKQLTIGVQTETLTKANLKHNLQGAAFCNQTDSDKTNTGTIKSTSSNAGASRCDSFEYVKNSEKEQGAGVEIVDSLKHTAPKIDNTKKSVSSGSSQDLKLIKTVSKNADNDIERSIYVLQKLLKSKKYDSSTKKRYMKKILQKITESKYLEDSSTSSELFYPKSDPSKILKDQMKHASFKTEESTSSYQSHEEQKFSPTKKKSSESLKFQNVKESICPNKNAHLKLSSKTEGKYSSSNVSEDSKVQKTNIPQQVACTITTPLEKGDPSSHKESKLMQFKNTMKGPFTITNKPLEPAETLDKNYQSSSSFKSQENWKDSQTNSELLASNGKSGGDGDHLINFADKERQFQLNWIAREINHLGKLKSLLEKPRETFGLDNVQATTSVYMVTGTKTGNNKGSDRNYVIETQLGVKGCQQRNFRINGENYGVVQDPQAKKKKKKCRPVVADIEVHSDSKTTNIKVTTFCSICKKTPCICNPSVLENLLPCKVISKNNTSSDSVASTSRYSMVESLPCQKERRAREGDNESNGSKYFVCQACPCVCDCVCNCKDSVQSITIPVKGYLECPKNPKELTEVCLCELASDGSSSSMKENQPESSSNLFINCKCVSGCDCNCNFVNKLLQHFSKQDVKNTCVQGTHESDMPCNCEVQTETDNREIKPSSALAKTYSELNVDTTKSQAINNINIVIDNVPVTDEEIKISNPTKTGSIAKRSTIERAVCYETQRNIQDSSQPLQTDQFRPKSSTYVESGKNNRSVAQEPACRDICKANYNPDNREAQIFNNNNDDLQPSKYTEVNVGSEKSQNINNFNIVISTSKLKPTEHRDQATSYQSTPRLSMDKAIGGDPQKLTKGTSSKVEGHENTGTPDDLYALISKIEQALLDKKIITRVETDDHGNAYKPLVVPISRGINSLNNKESKSKTVDGATAYDPPCCKCSDQATTYEPPMTITSKIRDFQSNAPNWLPKSVDEGTTYTLPMQDICCQCDSEANSLNEGATFNVDKVTVCTPPNQAPCCVCGLEIKSCKELINKGMPEVTSVDECVCTSPRTQVDAGTLPEPVPVNQGASYKPPQVRGMVDKDTYYKPPEVVFESETGKQGKGGPPNQAPCCVCGLEIKSRKEFINKGMPEVTSVDECVCTSPRPQVDAETLPEPVPVNQGTSYKPPQVRGMVHKDTYYKPPEIVSESETGKQGKGGLMSVQVSKDVESVNVEFCLCSSSKQKKKIEKQSSSDQSEGSDQKKRRRHKKSCSCTCKKCSPSSKDSSTNSNSYGDSKNNAVCRNCQCSHKEKPCECCCANNESSGSVSTTNTSSTFDSASTPVLVCALCNRKHASDEMSMLRTSTEELAVCPECMAKRPILTSTCYVGPDHTCNQPSSDHSKSEIDGFSRLDSYCTCPRGPRAKNKNFEYCPHCRNQLRHTLKSKNSIAYTLTLENEDLEKCRYRKKKKSILQEIKVKVPCPYNRKNLKNNENTNRKEEERIKRLESGEDSPDNNSCDANAVKDIVKKTVKKNSINKMYTLQEYLKKNRPDFIDSADYRRRAVSNNRIEREQFKDDMKLKFLDENETNNNLKRQNKLFSEQEMRDITKKNYKKLPEVQRKLDVARMQKLRSADKFITEQFKKKVQNCILKGKSNFPLDTNIVNYWK